MGEIVKMDNGKDNEISITGIMKCIRIAIIQWCLP